MNSSDILNKHKLKRTSCREGIINVIMSANEALSENEIREQLSGHYDRTTFYRSFKTLEKHKITHKIVVDDHLVKYAIDSSITKMNEHAHFYCNHCKTVLCIDSMPIKKVNLPDRYIGLEAEVIIKGICAECNDKR